MISSRRNKIVRRLQSLSSPKGRYKDSVLLLEGRHLLQEALLIGCMPSEVIATPEWIEEHSELIKDVHSEVKFHIVTQSVLKAALTTVNPDGVACLLPLTSLPKPNYQASFVLALDRLQDPGNLGTLFRTALAAEVEVIWLALGADPLSQKVLRSSAGAVLSLPFQRLGNTDQNAIEELSGRLKEAQKRGLQVICTYAYSARDLLPSKVSLYWEIDWSKPSVLVLGNEGSGVHPKIQACCTHGVTLPHNKLVESLNVASAAVPILMERLRAKMTS